MSTIVLTLDPTLAIERKIRRQVMAESQGTIWQDSKDEGGNSIRVARSILQPRMGDSAKASAESAQIDLPTGADVTLTLTATEPVWPSLGAVTIELHVPSTDTIIASHTVNASSPLPQSFRVPLTLRAPLPVVLLAHAHDATTGAITVEVESVPWADGS